MSKPWACRKLELPCGSIVDASSDKRFVCGVCSHRVRTRFSLDLHCRRHTGQKRFICEFCSSGYNQATALKHHQAARHPEEIAEAGMGLGLEGKPNPYQCQTCNKVYCTPTALKIHEVRLVYIHKHDDTCRYHDS